MKMATPWLLTAIEMVVIYAFEYVQVDETTLMCSMYYVLSMSAICIFCVLSFVFLSIITPIIQLYTHPMVDNGVTTFWLLGYVVHLHWNTKLKEKILMHNTSSHLYLIKYNSVCVCLCVNLPYTIHISIIWSVSMVNQTALQNQLFCRLLTIFKTNQDTWSFRIHMSYVCLLHICISMDA